MADHQTEMEQELKDNPIYQTIKEMNPTAINDYIDNNITDLASAKTYLKKLSKVVLYLFKRVSD